MPPPCFGDFLKSTGWSLNRKVSFHTNRWDHRCYNESYELEVTINPPTDPLVHSSLAGPILRTGLTPVQFSLSWRGLTTCRFLKQNLVKSVSEADLGPSEDWKSSPPIIIPKLYWTKSCWNSELCSEISIPGVGLWISEEGPYNLWIN